MIIAAIEAEISQLDASDKDEFLAELGLEEAGLRGSFGLAIVVRSSDIFYCRAQRLVPGQLNGATAPQAAGHSYRLSRVYPGRNDQLS